MEYLEKIHELAARGFLCEVVTDGWANWKFKNGKPDIETCTPATLQLKHCDEFHSVGWRGCFWYFDKHNKLHQDDVGLFGIENGGVKRAYDELFRHYESIKHEINSNGFLLVP
jgi:hypothetical protein